MGVVVRKYIDILTIIINFLYSTCIRSFFWQQHPYFFVHFLNVFFTIYIQEMHKNKKAKGKSLTMKSMVQKLK